MRTAKLARHAVLEAGAVLSGLVFHILTYHVLSRRAIRRVPTLRCTWRARGDVKGGCGGEEEQRKNGQH